MILPLNPSVAAYIAEHLHSILNQVIISNLETTEDISDCIAP